MSSGLGISVRPPAVAGSFYPGAPAALRASVVSLMREAEHAPTHTIDHPKAIIVPHAGYIYSGAAAAAGFARLARDADTITRIVLLGPAHRAHVRGLAAPSTAAFSTPLGEIALDRAAIDALADLAYVTIDDHAHAHEHSLEVQLPFLQRILKRFTLVPLVVGAARDDQVATVIERLWGGPETRFVVSSDLSHYLPSDEARRIDAVTAGAIERLDPGPLTHDHACGRTPIAGLLATARRRALRIERLALCNSGDTAGPRDRVVGYGAWALG
ncbi:MAG: AmmeMemoRadiSam system protein B [Rhodospirillaceae bacterium]|nr:AmmeMemoRadiSam system protein B [Rhodospirillaceae bacterium]